MLTFKNTMLALSLAVLTPLATLPALGQENQAGESQTGDTPADAPQATAAPGTAAGADTAEVLDEAIAALQETSNALKALADDKPDAALAALERAIGKLEVTLEANPDLALAPVDVTSRVIDVTATPAEIRALRNEALRLMKDHQLQLARNLITGLASEVDISTTYIPLATYPLALKSAAALVRDEKPDAAVAVLNNALNTLVVVDTAVPLPLLNADLLIDEARKLSEKADRSADENARLATLLDALDVEIAKGEALEYGGEGGFDDIRAEMLVIRDKVSDGGAGSGFFDRLKALFGKLGRDHLAASAQ